MSPIDIQALTCLTVLALTGILYLALKGLVLRFSRGNTYRYWHKQFRISEFLLVEGWPTSFILVIFTLWLMNLIIRIFEGPSPPEHLNSVRATLIVSDLLVMVALVLASRRWLITHRRNIYHDWERRFHELNETLQGVIIRVVLISLFAGVVAAAEITIVLFF
jgi:hypothetical protein